MDYILRNIDEATWREVRSRAALDGTTVRDVLLTFIADYARAGERTRRQLASELERAGALATAEVTK